MEGYRKVELVSSGYKTRFEFQGIQMSKMNNVATIADLWKVNNVLKKVTSKDSKLFYRRIGKKENCLKFSVL